MLFSIVFVNSGIAKYNGSKNTIHKINPIQRDKQFVQLNGLKLSFILNRCIILTGNVGTLSTHINIKLIVISITLISCICLLFL